MKKTVLAIIGLSMSYLLMAQEPAAQPVAEQSPAKQKEIGLVFNSLNRFGLTFRTGTEKSMWRFQSVVLSSSYRKETDQDSKDVTYLSDDSGITISLGKEYRMAIADKFAIRFGGDVSINNEESTYESENVERTEFLGGIGLDFVLGFNYTFHEHFIVGAELLPYYNYSIGESTAKYNYGTEDGRNGETVSKIKDVSYGMTNNSALLSLVYRF